VYDGKNTFADRVELLDAAAADLRKVLDIVEAEAKIMAEVQEHFAAKSARRSTKDAE
jgi:hypothetical protein